MKHFLILAFALTLGGCYNKNINGEFSVYEAFELKKGNKTITVEPNEYSATLRLKSKKKFQLIVPGVKGKKFTFKFPKQFVIPRTNGSLKLSSRDLNQPVDVELNFNSDTARSSVNTVAESCSRTFYDRVCRWQTTPARRVCRTDSHGRRVCRTEPARRRRVCRSVPRTIYGTRDVTVRTVSTETVYVAELFRPSSDEIVATFNAREFKSRREVLNRGACRLDYPRNRRY
jgi:hypothetical protein